MRVGYATVALLTLAILGCVSTRQVAVPPVVEGRDPGALQKAERLGFYPAPGLRALTWWAGMPSSGSITHGITLYRLHYWTTRFDETPTLASGLLALPKDGPLRGVVSYQHGTRTQRRAAPSKPTLEEGVIGAAVFAGGGYLFLAPDYIGLGAGTDFHPYMHAPSTANATVDLLKAAHAFTGLTNRIWPEDLYLVGFSQGGHATLAAQRKLESLDDPRFRVKASAPVAGAFDLANLTFPKTLEGRSEASTLYLAYLVQSYCAIYGHSPSELVAETYAERLPVLFDGKHNEDTVAKALPKSPRDLFTSDFMAAYHRGQTNWFLAALAENEETQWSPKAPIRMYYGEQDVDVSPEEARHAAAELSKRGGTVSVVSEGACDHVGSVMRAIPQIRRWFDELAATASR